MRLSEISEICSRPLAPGKISTNAPKVYDPGYFAQVGLANFRNGADVGDHLDAA
jgi:hypothetical protein